MPATPVLVSRRHVGPGRLASTACRRAATAAPRSVERLSRGGLRSRHGRPAAPPCPTAPPGCTLPRTPRNRSARKGLRRALRTRRRARLLPHVHRTGRHGPEAGRPHRRRDLRRPPGRRAPRQFRPADRGLTGHDSRVLIDLFQSHIERPEHTTRWQWRTGDVALWDNRATQHYGVDDSVATAGCAGSRSTATSPSARTAAAPCCSARTRSRRLGSAPPRVPPPPPETGAVLPERARSQSPSFSGTRPA
ncbi:TauD/TfdA dioxygenase family protein [Streptomyces sp. NPDC058357]|uniref:TauD/TfdA dioxygenase family protein n=1 Tax=unclassified Streptomyces TaxID=2593676 RepID=UPI00364D60C1